MGGIDYGSELSSVHVVESIRKHDQHRGHMSSIGIEVILGHLNSTSNASVSSSLVDNGKSIDKRRFNIRHANSQSGVGRELN